MLCCNDLFIKYLVNVPGPRPGPGQGAGAGTPWARGRGQDPLGQGPGAPGPKMWDTRGERNYLLSGKPPTIRQATYYQASYLLSGMHPNVAADFAPNNRIHAPNRSIDMHPKGIDMHPNVAAYFAPNNRILAQVAFLGKT